VKFQCSSAILTGYAPAAVRKLDSNCRMDLCRNLLCGHERCCRLLSSSRTTLESLCGRGMPSSRHEVMGNVFAGLSQLNRRDRPNVRVLGAPDDNLQHFRAVACEILIGDGRCQCMGIVLLPSHSVRDGSVLE
jgi:hypothetical protein